MRKKVYYLKDEALPKVQTSFPVVAWIFKWKTKNGELKWKPSEALLELTEKYYFDN